MHLNFLDLNISVGVFRPRLKGHLDDQAVLRPTMGYDIGEISL